MACTSKSLVTWTSRFSGALGNSKVANRIFSAGWRLDQTVDLLELFERLRAGRYADVSNCCDVKIRGMHQGCLKSLLPVPRQHLWLIIRSLDQ